MRLDIELGELGKVVVNDTLKLIAVLKKYKELSDKYNPEIGESNSTVILDAFYLHVKKRFYLPLPEGHKEMSFDDILSAVTSKIIKNKPKPVGDKSMIEKMNKFLEENKQPIVETSFGKMFICDAHQVAAAKTMLRDLGYYVENLWRVEDVFAQNTEEYNISKEDAMEILDTVMHSQIESINNAISRTLDEAYAEK